MSSALKVVPDVVAEMVDHRVGFVRGWSSLLTAAEHLSSLEEPDTSALSKAEWHQIKHWQPAIPTDTSCQVPSWRVPFTCQAGDASPTVIVCLHRLRTRRRQGHRL